MCDTVFGQDQPFDVWDLEKLYTVVLEILPLGKLVHSGWPLYFESSNELMAVTPNINTQSHFRVELGDDDTLHLPHEMHLGKQAAPLPEILQQDINRLITQVLHAK